MVEMLWRKKPSGLNQMKLENLVKQDKAVRFEAAKLIMQRMKVRGLFKHRATTFKTLEDGFEDQTMKGALHDVRGLSVTQYIADLEALVKAAFANELARVEVWWPWRGPGVRRRRGRGAGCVWVCACV